MSIYLGSNLISGGGSSGQGSSMENLYIFGYFTDDNLDTIYFPDLDLANGGKYHIDDLFGAQNQYSDIQFLVPSSPGEYDTSTAQPNDDYYSVGRISRTADDSLGTISFINLACGSETNDIREYTKASADYVGDGKFFILNIEQPSDLYIIKGYWDYLSSSESKTITLQSKYDSNLSLTALKEGKTIVFAICNSKVTNWSEFTFRTPDGCSIGYVDSISDEIGVDYITIHTYDGKIYTGEIYEGATTVTVYEKLSMARVITLASVKDGTIIPNWPTVLQDSSNRTIYQLRYGIRIYNVAAWGNEVGPSRFFAVDEESLHVLCVNETGEIYESHDYDLSRLRDDYQDILKHTLITRDYYYEDGAWMLGYANYKNDTFLSNVYQSMINDIKDNYKVRVTIPLNINDRKFLELTQEYDDNWLVFAGDDMIMRVYDDNSVEIDYIDERTQTDNVTVALNYTYSVGVYMQSSGTWSSKLGNNLDAISDMIHQTNCDLFINNVLGSGQVTGKANLISTPDGLQINYYFTCNKLDHELTVTLKSGGTCSSSLIITNTRLTIRHSGFTNWTWNHSTCGTDLRNLVYGLGGSFTPEVYIDNDADRTCIRCGTYQILDEQGSEVKLSFIYESKIYSLTLLDGGTVNVSEYDLSNL